VKYAKILEYPLGIPCYMNENNIKIDPKNYCFKLGRDISGWDIAFAYTAMNLLLKKGGMEVPHQLLEIRVRKDCFLLYLACR
jgi:hypothetical protein